MFLYLPDVPNMNHTDAYVCRNANVNYIIIYIYIYSVCVCVCVCASVHACVRACVHVCSSVLMFTSEPTDHEENASHSNVLQFFLRSM